MRKFWILICVVFLFSSCGTAPAAEESAEGKVLLLTKTFGFSDGIVYSSRADAPCPLTDAMIARMFEGCGELSVFAHVDAMAVYCSRRFSPCEITVMKLSDRSHRDEAVRLCRARAAKKKNAAVYADGVYVYLLCTEKNAEILDFLR